MKEVKLGLEHRDILYGRLRRIGNGLSEYSFANLYLFRNLHGYRVLTEGEETWIRGRDRRGSTYLMPTRDIREMDAVFLEEMIRRFGPLFPVPEEWTEHLEGEVFALTWHQDDSDYIHNIEKLSSYQGKKMQKKRNLKKQFLNQYNYEALPLTEERLDDARKILAAWQEEVALPPEETDFRAAGEAIDLYDNLILCGGIYYVEEEPAGYIIGEEVAGDMFVLHFAKGLRRVKGIYQFMYSNFARIMPDHYVSFNFEQDLGSPALRQAKESYRPDAMLKKYYVSLRKGS